MLLLTQEARAQTFYESGGLIVIEAESVPPTGDWQLESSLADFTGSGYYRWNGPLLLYDHSQGIIGYHIHVTNPGTYNLRLRSNHPPGDQYNDCWSSLDNGPWTKTYASAPAANQWVWHTQFDYGNSHPQASYDLSAGTHTLYISGRAPEFSIDRIHLYLNSVANGTDPNSPESSTSGNNLPVDDMAVVSLSLVDADSDERIDEFDPLQDGDEINFATLSTVNINVQAMVTGAVGSVRFDVDGGMVQVENGAPYALVGDDGQGDFYPWTPTLGTHTITATPFSQPDANGIAGVSVAITVTVIDDDDPPDPGGTGGAGAGEPGEGGSDPATSADPGGTGGDATGTSGVGESADGEPPGQGAGLHGTVFGCALRAAGSAPNASWLAMALMGLLAARRRRSSIPSRRVP